MPRRALLAVVGLALACGSKTALLPGGAGQGASSGSGGGGGGGATPLAVKCTAALLDGAPTPIQGYCPTRANQAAGNGPRAPKIVWSVTPFPIATPEDYLPAEVVVDATGRAYIAINASPQNAAGGPNQILAVNADGSVAWTSTFSTAIGQLALGRDGTLWFLQQPLPPSMGGPFGGPLIVGGLSAEGVPTAGFEITGGPGMPQLGAYAAMAIASDGSLFLGAQGSLARFATNGALRWQAYAYLASPLIVGPDDGVVAAGGGQLQAFDAAGGPTWTGPQASLAAIDAQGDVVALSSPLGATLSLMTLGAGGLTLQDAPLGSPVINASRLAVAGDGTALVLLANEVSSPGLTKTLVQILAVEPSGATRWTTPLEVTLPYDPADLTTHYGLFVDGSGTVVVTAGSVTGLDLASGSVLWTLLPASGKSCLRPAVLGAGGSIVATQCDGSVFLARDP